MIYSTPEFVALLIVLGSLARFLGSTGRQILLLAGSTIFIAWAGWITSGILFAVSLVLWIAVRLGQEVPQHRRALIAAAVGVLGLNLFFWKYWTWVADQLGIVPGPVTSLLLEIGLPIGVSFYTLTAISYLVDFQRGVAKDAGLVDFLLFQSFFAHLIAGPLVRHDELMPQAQRPPRATVEDVMAGTELFCIGLFKKMVLGDRPAKFVDPVFADPGNFSAATIICALALYAVQIYGDFSGYTDMGRGAARICGVRLPENFNAPYFATSIRDFWRRWHMTLGRFLRDYIYIPLGGSRVTPGRASANLMITWTIGGFWHGAAWNFVLWGMYQGALMVFERTWERTVRWTPPPSVSIPLTFVAVMAGWMLFRIEDLGDLGAIADKMGSLFSAPLALDRPMLATAAVALVLTFVVQWLQARRDSIAVTVGRLPAWSRGLAIGSLAVTAIALRGIDAPFIYFAF